MYQKMFFRTFILITIFTVFLAISCASNQTYSTKQKPKGATIHFIDVGNGDCTLFVLSSGDVILVDTGPLSASHRVSTYLRGIGISTIDHLILTHAHDDHIGGIFAIMSDFSVRNVYDNGFGNEESSLYQKYALLIRNGFARYHILKVGEYLDIGDTHIKVLQPRPPPSNDHNRDSLVMKIQYGRIGIFMAGDMPSGGDEFLLKRHQDLSSQILKVSHHGDRDATSDEVVKHLNPEIAVISVGKDNRYARPHSEVLKRLERFGTRVYRTDIDGDIIVTTDGEKYTVQTTQ